MIKFFRKIRQKLIEEDRFKKYLLYALGEIILVVLGILIALQVSNWNEKRKLQERINEFYPKLKLQIEDNIQRVDDDLYGSKVIFNGSKNIVEIFGSKINETKKLKLDSLILYTGTDFYLNLDMITLNEAKLNEDLSLIKSDSLRKAIYTFIKIHDDVVEREKIVNEDLKNNLKPFLNKNYNLKNLFNSLGYSGLSRSKLYKNDEIKIVNNQEFENLIVTRIMYIEDLIFLYSDLLDELNLINKLLENEIANYNGKNN